MTIKELPIVALYIDPGTGYVFSSAIPAIIGILLTAMSGIFLFFRKRLILLIAVIFLIIAVIIFLLMNSNLFNTPETTSTDNKLIILGFDGLDPNILEDGFKKNLLPNFKRLKDTGYYSTLQTVVPPQSPVAWASFITASDPAKHGIYDFIERDAKTLSVDLVFSNLEQKKFNIPPFWEITSKYKIPSTILFLPDTFPPEPLEGKMLSGMGVPDVMGTAGTFSIFSTKNIELDPKWRGKFIPIENSETISTSIEGPKYLFLRETKTADIPFQIKVDNKNKKVNINIQNQKIILSENEFSDWVTLEFKIDLFTKIHGIAKFYLKQIGPDLEIYLSPVNFDPDRPQKPISYPQSYAKELKKKYGFYHTQGLPQDTWALEEDVFDEAAFLKQADEILGERKKIYYGELQETKKGLFFAYFGVTDSVAHMFWRYLNIHDSKYQNTILDYYRKVDSIVGETLGKMNKNDTLIILSDHGFAAFDYEINLNTWLKEQGYLTLKEGKDEGSALLSDVDWNKTKVYALGYNSVFFNKFGREKEGILTDADINALEKDLITKLENITNPYTNQKIIKKVYIRKDLGISDNDTNAPDMIIGFYKGIRSSWDTAVGGAPKNVINKRTSKWSGDHLYDPSEVPGILMSNKKLETNNPKITEVIPLVYKILNIPKN